MIRAVFDTNILLRMAAGGERSQLNRYWYEQQFDLLISLTTFVEFRTVAARPEIQRYVPLSIGQAFLRLLEARAVVVQPDLRAPTCRDPQDTGLIATAVGGQADFLVTADLDLLDDLSLSVALDQLGIRIVRATEFISHLAQAQTGL